MQVNYTDESGEIELTSENEEECRTLVNLWNWGVEPLAVDKRGQFVFRSKPLPVTDDSDYQRAKGEDRVTYEHN